MNFGFMDDLTFCSESGINDLSDCSFILLIFRLHLFLNNHLIFIEFGFECRVKLFYVVFFKSVEK